jgi:glycerol-3-phosphate dehydrogenase
VTRDLRRLADTSFDLLVIGAGIYGATIAWDAALRGLSVAIVDRDDFGAATSANSLKTVHGGLRSLQRGALREMRQFIRERRALLRIAPHLVTPLTFVVPTSRHPLRNPVMMQIALVLNDAIASDRNEGVPACNRLHDGRLMPLHELHRMAPDLAFDGVLGGASWCDAQMLNSERLTFEFVVSAVEAGAVAANHAEVKRILTREGRAIGARVRDRLTGEAFDVRAKVTVNAAGAWAASMSAAACGMPARSLMPPLSRALNVVTRRPAGPCAVGGLSDGRFFFRVPWCGVTMYGTSHEPFDAAPDAVQPPASAVESLLADVNRAFPGNPVPIDEVSFVHWGLLPARPGGGPHVELAKHSLVRDHRTDGVDGLITVIGARYTTARQTAETAVNLAFGLLGHVVPPASRSDRVPLVGAHGFDPARLESDVRRALPDCSRPLVARLARTYGMRAPDVAQRMANMESGATPLSPECPITAAEVDVAVRDEMACTLADVVLRRTEAGTAGHPGPEALGSVAALMAAALGWTRDRAKAEVEEVEARYRLARSVSE